MPFNILFNDGFLFRILVVYFVYSVFCIALCTVSPFMLSLPIFVQVYRPLPPGGNPTAVNK